MVAIQYSRSTASGRPKTFIRLGSVEPQTHCVENFIYVYHYQCAIRGHEHQTEPIRYGKNESTTKAEEMNICRNARRYQKIKLDCWMFYSFLSGTN